MALNPYDQQVYDAGFKFIPQSQYLQNPFLIPQDTIETGSGGGVTTLPISMGGGSGGGYSGGVNSLIDNFNLDTRNQYFDRQPTPLVDDLYQSKLDKTFMGFPSYKKVDQIGPFTPYNQPMDMDDPAASIENIIASRNVPLEQTMAGSIQSKIGNVTGGIKDLMGKVPSITGLLSMIGVKNFESLPPLDQEFIKQRSGYTGPTIFGENTAGTSKDPFGRNVESLFGNYAEKVREDFTNLSTMLGPEGKIGGKYKGATFNPETGVFEADDDEDEKSKAAAAKANKMNKINIAKFLFDQKEIKKQKKLDAEMAAKAKNINSPDNYGAQGLQRSGNYGGNDTYSGQGSTVDRAGNVTGSQGQDLGNINDEFARGGRVAYMDGGLADMLEIYD